MTPQTALAALVFLGLAASPALADETTGNLTGCAAKASAISKQIEEARTAGNTHKQAGLEKALRQAGAHCTDSGLRKRKEAKADRASDVVTQRKADLAAALEKGDAEKVNKRQRKLAESEQDLQRARAELAQ